MIVETSHEAYGTVRGFRLGFTMPGTEFEIEHAPPMLGEHTDDILGELGLTPADNPITLERMLGFVFRPFAWLIGVSWGESQDVGSLLGIKTVLNELIAYSEMKDQLAANRAYLSPRAALLTTYALCGFANFASVGIQVGGIATLAPARRADLSRIGLLAMAGGAIASLMAACVVGVLL